jgi:hypothetical protein
VPGTVPAETRVSLAHGQTADVELVIE